MQTIAELIQFFAVYHKDGTIDTKRVICVEFNPRGGMKRISLDVPRNTNAPIIRINRKEFERKVTEYSLKSRRIRLTSAERRERKRLRSKAWRLRLAENIPQRSSRNVDQETRNRVEGLIKQHVRGVDIAREVGVSPSYISLVKKSLA